MTKSELIDAIANESGVDKKQVKEVLEGLTAVVEKAVAGGGEVALSGLGKFKTADRAARMGRNPQTGEEIPIPARRVVKFSVAKNLKDAALKG